MCITRFKPDYIRCTHQHRRGGKEVILTGSSRANWNAGNGTNYLILILLKRRRSLKNDMIFSNEQVIVDKKSPFTRLVLFRKWKDITY